jgi:signal transduction histidine kinase/CheY-like chemotaxis protein
VREQSVTLVTHTFLRDHRGEIVAAWERAVAREQRKVTLTGSALRDHLAEFLEEVATWLEGAEPTGASELRAAAARHAATRLTDGYQLRQLIGEFRLLRTTILRLLLEAEPPNAGDSDKENRVVELARLNAGLDHAITDAVEEFVAREAAHRKEAEDAVRGSEERFRALVSASSDVVYRMSADWSEMRQLRGEGAFLAATDAPTTNWLEKYIHPDDQRRVKDAIGEAIRSRSTFELEHRVLRLDGSVGWTYSRAIPVKDASGAIVEWFGAASDITDRKRAELALEEANTRLRESDRNKDEFLGMLSHELRNPLAPIRNSVYVLERADPKSEQAMRARSVIQRQTEHLTRIVDDLLDVNRIARGKIELRLERVDLRDVVRRTAEDLRSVIESGGVTFRVDVPDEKVLVAADVTRLAQVVGNLLQNAAKFTRRGDTVTVSVRAADGAEEISVRDTGAGIDATLLPDMFQPFVQGERTLARTQGGLGLGLALVKGITELHGGTVRAESAGRGKGAEFVVRLPVVPAGVTRERQHPGPELTNERRKVLVVEDSVDAAESLADLVTMLGHDVEVAYDGPSAIEKAGANPPDVVLCDIGLPGMSGYEVAKALRAKGATGIQLVAVSGYAQPEDLEAALEAGFDRHIAKPPNPDDIERLLG